MAAAALGAHIAHMFGLPPVQRAVPGFAPTAVDSAPVPGLVEQIGAIFGLLSQVNCPVAQVTTVPVQVGPAISGQVVSALAAVQNPLPAARVGRLGITSFR